MEPRGASCGWCGATHLSANSSASLRVRWCTAALLTSYENVGNTCGVMPGGTESVGLQAQGCPLAIHRLQVIIEASGEGCLN